MEWRVVTAPIEALLRLVGRGRRPSGSSFGGGPGGPYDGPDASGVREPRRPGPQAGGAGVALEPPPEAQG